MEGQKVDRGTLFFHLKIVYCVLALNVVFSGTVFFLWLEGIHTNPRCPTSTQSKVNEENVKLTFVKPLRNSTRTDSFTLKVNKSRSRRTLDSYYIPYEYQVGQRSKRQSNPDYELCQRILINCNFKIQGPPGPKGGRGNNGLPGPKGDKGERGYTGVVGSTGAPGQKGARGDPGIPGPIGIRGPEGRQGNIGNQGSPGRQGNKGNKGEPGEQGPKGYQGVVGFPGKKGPAGEKGSKGEQGINGPVGYVGPMGQKGEKGDIGGNGTQGEKGRRGRHGKRGPNGPEGERGPEGVQGEPGIKGEKGDPGPRSASDDCSCPKGDKGEKGQRGLIGFTGYKGDKGESGRKGDLGHGIRGSDGPQGPPGTKGVKGDKGDCDVISSIAMENRISETKNPYITNKPIRTPLLLPRSTDCRDETTTEVKTTTVLTTSEPPTTAPDPTTTTKPPTTTTRPKLAARSRDCYIKKIGTPMFERKFGPRIGAWMRENRYTWVTNGESGKYLHEFRSKASFMSNEDDQTIDLKSYEYHGNNHAVYKGSFYFHWRDGMIVCYDLQSKSVVTSTILDDADVGTNLYKGSSSNFDIEVDEYGLWIIYANKYDSENTHIIKIDPHTMITLQKWRIAVTPGSHGNAFVAGGVVYFVKDTRKRVSSIDYAFDLFYNKPIPINTRFVNPFRYNTMISYSGSANFRARKIYGWDNGAQIVYPLLFYCVE